ncbi:MAG: quinone-dependent dihydroorotate dehydrogenase [Bacteroidota bacterium]
MSYRLIRPLLFSLKPETAHEFVMKGASLFEKLPSKWIRSLTSYQDPILKQSLFGCDFESPVGLAAGMDKDGEFIGFWEMMGMGFVEVGSITALPSEGNPEPRLFRLPKDEALINRMGLNNKGAWRNSFILGKMIKHYKIPVGINIAKTHSPDILGEAAIEDFVWSYKKLLSLGAYTVLNISCPNTEEGKTFEEPEALKELLNAIRDIQDRWEGWVETKPLLVKLSPPSSNDWKPGKDFEEIMDILMSHPVDGLVISNTRSDREGLKTTQTALRDIGKGGLSGRPLQERSLMMMREVYKATEGKIPLIGVGGIDSAESAYQMIRAGASLVQIYTGLVYKGPGLIREIQKGVAKRLKRDGFNHISEAVGA